MGKNDEFTKEELGILGETEVEPETSTEEEPKEEETEKGEEVSEEGEPAEKSPETELEEKKEEEENLIPQNRFDKVYAEAKENERKFELLKTLGADEYFKIYPDDKPVSKEQPKPEIHDHKPFGIPTFRGSQNLSIEGGEYEGLTLSEVYDRDPVFAMDLFLEYRDEIKSKIEEETNQNKRIKAESEREVNDFAKARAQELFKKDVDALSKEEAKQVDDLIDNILLWMQQTKRGAGIIEDAYFLMNKENLLSEAKDKAVKNMAKTLQKGTSKTVVTSGSGDEISSGYDSYTNLTPSQMADKIDQMTEGKYKEFIKKAPQQLKAKFPSIDWGPL